MPRWLGVLLAASLLLNVFAGGMIGGGLFMLSRPAVWRTLQGGAGRPIRGAGEELPPPDRRHFRQTMRQVVQENGDLVRTARDNRAAAAQLFVQSPFDASGIAAALERARAADVALRSRLEAAAIDFAAGLPPEKRALLAFGLAHGGPLRPPAAAAEDKAQ